MKQIVQIEYIEVAPKEEYEAIIKTVMKQCFQEEQLMDSNLYVSVTLTNPDNIQKMNKEYRNIDKATDVLSFPMFEKEEIASLLLQNNNVIEDVLGDIVISIQRVENQAKEYGHSFNRELAYMIVHGFYHLMGYDHINDEDKRKMRPKEEKVLQELKLIRI